MNRPALLSRIRDAAGKRGAKPKLAAALGYSRSTIYEKLEAGSFTLDELQQAAAALLGGVPEDYMAAAGDSDAPTYSLPSAEDFIFLPRYEVKAAAGSGQAVVSEQIVDHLAFRRDWVTGVLGLDPKELLLIEALGDSMVPTIHGGDLLLLHIRVPRLASGAIYAIGVDDDLIVKRIERRTDGTVQLRSDNPAVAPEDVAPGRIGDLRVIGRVVWIGRRM